MLFDYRYPDTQLIEKLVLSIAKQLLVKRSSIPKELYQLLREPHKSHYPERPDLKQAAQILQKATGLYDRVYLIIDALDECRGSVQAHFLQEISIIGKPRLQVLCTLTPKPNDEAQLNSPMGQNESCFLVRDI